MHAPRLFVGTLYPPAQLCAWAQQSSASSSPVLLAQHPHRRLLQGRTWRNGQPGLNKAGSMYSVYCDDCIKCRTITPVLAKMFRNQERPWRRKRQGEWQKEGKEERGTGRGRQIEKEKDRYTKTGRGRGGGGGGGGGAWMGWNEDLKLSTCNDLSLSEKLCSTAAKAG